MGSQGLPISGVGTVFKVVTSSLNSPTGAGLLVQEEQGVEHPVSRAANPTDNAVIFHSSIFSISSLPPKDWFSRNGASLHWAFGAIRKNGCVEWELPS